MTTTHEKKLKLDLGNLPDDPELLKTLVLDLFGELKNNHVLIDKLRHQLNLLRRNQFGSRGERFNPAQMLLEIAGDLPFELEQPADQGERKPEPKNGHGRKPLPAHLPRKREEIEPSAEKKVCPECSAQLEKIGEEKTEQLEYVPASFFVREIVRIKYACKGCAGQVVIADLPAMPIEKGRPGPGLLAHVAVSKYADHAPLHRQEAMLKRHGIDIRRSTLSDWVRETANLLRPIADAMTAAVLKSKKIHTDDTPVPVLDGERETTRKGRFWVYSGDDDHPYTVYDYTPDRSRNGPADFLGDYKGYLQADAYRGYDRLYGENMTEVACWAHARRKFFEARDTDPEPAHTALTQIKLLYQVEREAKSLSADDRKKLRDERSRPLLEHFHEWLLDQTGRVLPKSPVGQAVSYALSNWTALTRYLDDGDLDIDNNAAERALRCIAIGRKNWTFLGSDRGGERAAVIYTLIASCRRHGVEPWAYLRDLIERVSVHPASRIDELFPDRWEKLRRQNQTAVEASADEK